MITFYPRNSVRNCLFWFIYLLVIIVKKIKFRSLPQNSNLHIFLFLFEKHQIAQRFYFFDDMKTNPNICEKFCICFEYSQPL